MNPAPSEPTPPPQLAFGGEPLTRFATFDAGIDGMALTYIAEQCDQTGAQFDLFVVDGAVEVWLVDR